MMCTVIIPTEGKRPELIKKAMKSYYTQNIYLDSEIIVETGVTLSQNINQSLLRAKGKWIKILADDDLLPPGSLASFVYYADNSGFDWLYANAENFTDYYNLPNGWPGIYKSSCNGLEQLKLKNTIHGGTTLYKKSMLFEVGGWDESLDTAEELDLHLNLLKHGYKHGYFDKVVYKYRLHQHQKSNSMGGKLKLERKQWIEKYIINRY